MSDSDVLLDYDIIEDIDWASIASIPSSDTEDEDVVATAPIPNTTSNEGERSPSEHEEPTIIPTLSRIREDELQAGKAKLSSSGLRKSPSPSLTKIERLGTYLAQPHVASIIILLLLAVLLGVAYYLKPAPGSDRAQVVMMLVHDLSPDRSQESTNVATTNSYTSLATTYTGTKLPSAWFGWKSKSSSMDCEEPVLGRDCPRGLRKNDKNHSVKTDVKHDSEHHSIMNFIEKLARYRSSSLTGKSQDSSSDGRKAQSPPLEPSFNPDAFAPACDTFSYTKATTQALSIIQQSAISAYHHVSKDVIIPAQMHWRKTAKVIRAGMNSVVSSSVTSLDSIHQFTTALATKAEEVAHNGLMVINSSSSLIPKFDLDEILQYVTKMGKMMYTQLVKSAEELKNQLQKEIGMIVPYAKHGLKVVKRKSKEFYQIAADKMNEVDLEGHLSVMKAKSMRLSGMIQEQFRKADIECQRNLKHMRAKSKEMHARLVKPGMRVFV